MRYAPRHAINTPRRSARWASTGLATAALTIGGGLATSSTAHADVWDRVAACESGGNWSINTGNGFSGGLQFTPSTWRAYGGSGSAQHASKAEQIRVAKRVLAGQGPGAWPVCSRKAGLTRGNGGASDGTAEARSSRSTERVSTYSSTKAKKRATKADKVERRYVKKADKVEKGRYTKKRVNTVKSTKRDGATRRVAAKTASYPGADAFVLGHRDPAVTKLGKRLIKLGFGEYYKVGAGPTFTEADKAAVAAFQKSLGWSGSDVSGYPGPATWAKLMGH